MLNYSPLEFLLVHAHSNINLIANIHPNVNIDNRLNRNSFGKISNFISFTSKK